MTRNELNKCAQQNFSEQGNTSSIVLSQVASELVKYIPSTVHADENSFSETEKEYTYTLTESQSEINAIIDYIVESETPGIYAYLDETTKIFFGYYEITIIDDNNIEITCYADMKGRGCYLNLCKEDISQITIKK